MPTQTLRYGTSDLVLLMALRANAEHAYRLWRRLSPSPLPFSKSLLYARLHSLASRGYLSTTRKGRTITYSVTPKGIAYLESEIELWRALSAYITSLTNATP